MRGAALFNGLVAPRESFTPVLEFTPRATDRRDADMDVGLLGQVLAQLFKSSISLFSQSPAQQFKRFACEYGSAPAAMRLRGEATLFAAQPEHLFDECAADSENLGHFALRSNLPVDCLDDPRAQVL